jgi:GGDEF domain-containing protein
LISNSPEPDEFLYLLVDPQGTENIERSAKHVLKNIAQPMAIEDLQLVIKASIGIAVYPDNGTTGEQLIRNADTAMYRGKNQMGGSVFFLHTGIGVSSLLVWSRPLRCCAQSGRGASQRKR